MQLLVYHSHHILFEDGPVVHPDRAFDFRLRGD